MVRNAHAPAKRKLCPFSIAGSVNEIATNKAIKRAKKAKTNQVIVDNVAEIATASNWKKSQGTNVTKDIRKVKRVTIAKSLFLSMSS